MKAKTTTTKTMNTARCLLCHGLALAALLSTTPLRAADPERSFEYGCVHFERVREPAAHGFTDAHVTADIVNTCSKSVVLIIHYGMFHRNTGQQIDYTNRSLQVAPGSTFQLREDLPSGSAWSIGQMRIINVQGWEQ